MKKVALLLFFSLMNFLFLSSAHASGLSSGSSVSGHIAANGSQSYTFSGNAGEAVVLVMDESVSSAGQIILYRPNGSYWTYGNNKVHVTLPDTGTYTVVLKYSSSYQSGNYKLHYVRGGDTVENGSLSSGSTHYGSLANYDMDSYTFSGSAGEAAVIILDETVSSAGQITLYRPDGSYWTYGNNKVHVTLPDTGIYTVVLNYSSISQQGDYALHYVLAGDTIENGAITSANTYANTLNPYDMDSYTFEGVQGEAVVLIMDESVSSAGQITLYRPDGSYWTYGNNKAHVTLPDTGTYTVVVSYSSIRQQGDYKLHFVRGGQGVENAALVSGTSKADTLNAYDMDSYTFEGVQGEAVVLIMDESVSSAGQITLYRPDGSYWTYDNNKTHVTLPDTGTYTVVVSYSSISQQGDYKLHFVRGGDSVEKGSISSGNTYSATLNAYDMDSYSFSGIAGKVLSFTLSESVSGVGQITLYRPDGSYWTYGNNSAYLTLPDTGEYTLIVTYSSIAQSGSYSLSYTIVP